MFKIKQDKESKESKESLEGPGKVCDISPPKHFDTSPTPEPKDPKFIEKSTKENDMDTSPLSVHRVESPLLGGVFKYESKKSGRKKKPILLAEGYMGPMFPKEREPSTHEKAVTEVIDDAAVGGILGGASGGIPGAVGGAIKGGVDSIKTNCGSCHNPKKK